MPRSISASLTEVLDWVHGAAAGVRWRLEEVGRPVPIDHLRAYARAELRRNPTITTYKFDDGIEVRRSVDLVARMRQEIQRMNQAVAAMFGAS